MYLHEDSRYDKIYFILIVLQATWINYRDSFMEIKINIIAHNYFYTLVLPTIPHSVNTSNYTTKFVINMAPAYSKVSFMSRKGQNRVVVPLVLLKRAGTKIEKGETISIHCRSVPTDKDSTSYKLSVPYFKKGSTKTFLRFLYVFDKACTGQDFTTGP